MIQVILIRSVAANPWNVKSKIMNSEFFDDNKFKILNFLAKCQFKFLNKSFHFFSEKSKIIYIKILLKNGIFF